MKQTQSIVRFLFLKQWEIVGAAVIAVIAAAAWAALFPLGRDSLGEGKKVLQSMSLFSKADSITAMAAAARAEANALDGVLKTIPDTQIVSEQAIPGYIYSIAGLCGMKASKVEIARRITTPEGVQVPVTLVGEGYFKACGGFIDGLENGEITVRIRDLDMKNSGRGLVTMFVDFVVLSQK